MFSSVFLESVHSLKKKEFIRSLDCSPKTLFKQKIFICRLYCAFLLNSENLIPTTHLNNSW